MDRRTFNKLAGFAALGTVTAESGLDAEALDHPPIASSSSEVVLEDDALLVAFDTRSGALTRMVQKSTGWVVQRRPQLGVSFRLHAPLANRRDNFILGAKQKAARVQKVSDHELRLEWKDLASEHGGVMPITLRATVTLRKGALTFEPTLINDSSSVVETVDYPYLGDLNPSARDTPLHARSIRYDNLESGELYPHFTNEKGYWGVDFPTKTWDSCYSLFCLLQSRDQGVYVGVLDPVARYLVQYTFEQHPGVLNSAGPFGGAAAYGAEGRMVPPGDEIAGTPVHLEFRTCHFLFAQPHSTTMLSPVVLRGYRGDWQAGADVYKEWRTSWYKPPRLPAWVTGVHSWQQLQLNSPEEEYRIKYRDLVRYGEECARNGVTAIQLVGWNHGGQDRGNPSQDTDPGLGTEQELRAAIAKIQAMGVKIILFGKFPWADMTTAWYKDELYKYAAIDPYGIPYENKGDSYHTPTQLAGINNHRFAVMDFQSPGYRDVATREFKKLLALGAAGWLYDEVCNCETGKYNFAPGHGYAAPGYIYNGVLPLCKQLRGAADEVNPDFLFAGEGPQDWLTQYYPVSYFRGSATPVERYISPQLPMLVAVNGFDDREQLNWILLYRSIISYEPYNFKGRLGDFPMTLAYGKKIDALRRKYKAWLWDAEFRDTVGASVTSDGIHKYSVFVTGEGKRAVVVVNLSFGKPLSATVALPNAGRMVVATPEQPEAEATSGTVQIPPRSAAVVMEI